MEALLYIHPHLREKMEGGDTLEKFFSKTYIFSNFYRVPNLVLWGRRYQTVEHWYQCQKAVFAGEYDLAEAIYWAPTPAATKKLAKELEGKLDLDAWREVQLFVMARGLEVKFSQANPHLLQALLNTEGKILDGFWGIQLGMNNPASNNPAAWPGRNWLGVILTHLRETLHPSV